MEMTSDSQLNFSRVMDILGTVCKSLGCTEFRIDSFYATAAKLRCCCKVSFRDILVVEMVFAGPHVPKVSDDGEFAPHPLGGYGGTGS